MIHFRKQEKEGIGMENQYNYYNPEEHQKEETFQNDNTEESLIVHAFSDSFLYGLSL